MEMVDQREKTIVFCANQTHALAIRDLINQAATPHMVFKTARAVNSSEVVQAQLQLM